MPRFCTIQLTGLDDVRKRKRDYIVLYGYRTEDVARRVVGVPVNERDAQDVMSQAQYLGTMPSIEVDDRFWFYVMAVGKAVFESGKEPTGA